MNNKETNNNYVNTAINVKINWINFLALYTKSKYSMFDLPPMLKRIESELKEENISIEDIDSRIISKLDEEGLREEKYYCPVNNHEIENIIIAKYLRRELHLIHASTDNEIIKNAIAKTLRNVIETNITYEGAESAMEVFTDDIGVAYDEDANLSEQLYFNLTLLNYIVIVLRHNGLDLSELEDKIMSILLAYNESFRIENVNSLIEVVEDIKNLTKNKGKKLVLS